MATRHGLAAGDHAMLRPALLGRVLIGFVVGLALALAGLGALDRAYDGRIHPGIVVGGVDVGGATPNEAATRLRLALGSVSEGTVTLTSPVATLSASYADLGREADVDAMVAEAMAAGRGGTFVDEASSILRSGLRPIALPARVTFDRSAVEARFADAAARLSRVARDAWVYDGPEGWRLVPGSSGGTADVAQPIATIERALADVATGPRIDARVAWTVSDPAVGDDEASAALSAATRMAADLRVTDGSSKWTLPAARVRSAIGFGRVAGRGYQAVLDPAPITSWVKTLAKKVGRDAVNAKFIVGRSGAIVGVSAARNGRSLDVEATTQRIVNVLRARADEAGPPASVALATKVVKPERTTEEATRIAPLMVRLGRWTTYYQVSAHNGYGANITIPARRLNGVVVEPGETFDFWRALGEVSLKTGYRMGGAIVNGHSVEGKALAGGICAASTTLFNAALRAGYEIRARSPHWYYIKRYPLGLDATVSGGAQTMRFRNDTPYPLVIRGFASPGVVRFEIWSVPSGRTTTFSKPIVKNVVRGYETVKYTSALEKGEREQIEWAVDGKDVWVTRTVRDASGAIVHRETFFSHYHRMVGVTLIGTG